MKKTIYKRQSFRAYDLPEDLVEFVAWVAAKAEAIPAEHRATARIEFESEYESSSTDVEIQWTRLETDQEEAEREEREFNEAYQRARAEERREREVLAKLQAKYAAHP